MPACLFLEDLGSLESNDLRMWSHPEGETSVRGIYSIAGTMDVTAPVQGLPRESCSVHLLLVVLTVMKRISVLKRDF